MKMMSIAMTLGLLATFLTIVPSANAHACAFDYGADCAKDCADDGKTHVHWGPRLVPCTSVPTFVLEQFIDIEMDGVAAGSTDAKILA